MRRATLLIAMVTVGAALGSVAMGDAVAVARTPTPRVAAGPSDFNGDGFADLVVGVPLEDINGQVDAGGINVLFGSSPASARPPTSSSARTARGSWGPRRSAIRSGPR